MSAKIVPIEICLLSRSPTYGNFPFRIYTAQHKYIYLSRLSCERPIYKMVFWKTFQRWIYVLWICIEKYGDVVEGKDEGRRCWFYCGAITYGRPAHSYILSGIPLPNHTSSYPSKKKQHVHIFHLEGGSGMIANVLIREDSLSSKEISFQVKLTDKSRPAAAAQPD